MTLDKTAQARQDLAELRKLILQYRSDLGVAEHEPAARARRGSMFRLRRPRRAPRQSPVA